MMPRAASSFSVASRLACNSSGKERDTETGLDYFGARYYGSTMGRFSSPDPVMVSSRRMVNPQVWNMYSYVANNPLNAIDPLGEELVQLGQHTDAEIDDRVKYLKAAMKDKELDLSKDQKANLKEEIKLLELEKEGNKVVGAMLQALDKKGQLNGLKLSDITLSTDTAKDFAGDKRIDMSVLLQKQAFVLHGEYGNTIFMRTEVGSYAQSRGDSDYTFFGGSVLRHEQRHVQFPGQERSALQLQRGIHQLFRNDYRNKETYDSLDQFLVRQIAGAKD